MPRLNHGRGLAALALFVCFGAPVTSLTALHAQTSPTSQLPLAAFLGSGGSPAAPSADAPNALPAGVSPADLTPVDVADALVYHKRYQAAIATYGSVEQKTASVWNKMGIAYQLMDNLKAAERCYKESIRLHESNAAAFNNLGTVYQSELDIRQAEKMFRKAVRIDPNFALGYKNLATTLLDEHKYEEGRAADERALILDPTDSDAGNHPAVGDAASARDRGAANYFMAIDCVRAGQTACALDHLRLALNEGYASPRKVAEDSNFSMLAGEPAFQSLLAEQK